MRHIHALLGRDPELAELSAKARALAASQEIWNAIAPATIRPCTRVGGVNQQQLTLYADSSAAAAKIRLLQPELLQRLQKQGVEVTSIRVRVQVQSVARAPQKTPRRLSARASTELQKFADQLETGSSLAATLRRLARSR